MFPSGRDERDEEEKEKIVPIGNVEACMAALRSAGYPEAEVIGEVEEADEPGKSITLL